jgi:hypothetical protein
MENLLRQKFADFETKPSESLWNRIADNIPSDHFESEVKEKLDAHEVIPSKKVWDGIESAIESQNTSDNNLWKYSTLIALFIVSAIAYYFISSEISNSHNQSNQTTSVSDEITQQPQLTIVDQSNKLKFPNSLNKNELSDIKTKHSKSRSINHTDSNNISTKTYLSNSNKLATDSQLPNQKDDLTAKTNAFTNEHKKVITDISSTSKQVNDEKHHNNTRNNHSDSVIFTPNNTVAKTTTQNQTDQNTSVDKSSEMPLSNLDSLTDVQTQKLPDVLYTRADSNLLHSKKPLVNKNELESLTNISITIQAGLNYAMMQLRSPAQSNLLFKDNIAMRQQVEKPNLDFSTAFLINYHLSEHWTLSSGVGLLNFNQTFYYNISTPTTLNQAIEPGAKYIHANDSIMKGNSYNSTIRYTWTEIPLLISYETKSIHKFKCFVQTGLSYAILGTVNAEMINFDNVGILVLSDKNSFPALQNSLFFQLNGGIYYQLNQTIELGAMPTFKYSLNSMIANESWIQQYPYLAGLTCNIRKRF